MDLSKVIRSRDAEIKRLEAEVARLEKDRKRFLHLLNYVRVQVQGEIGDLKMILDQSDPNK